MSISKLLKDGVGFARDYLAYPVVALVPGKVQPWLFSRLPHATDLAQEQEHHLDLGECLDEHPVIDASANYSKISGIGEMVGSPILLFVTTAYMIATDNLLNPHVIEGVALGSCRGRSDGAVRTGYATRCNRPIGAIEGIIEDVRAIGSALAYPFKSRQA